MNARTAWRWPLRCRGRLIALVLAALALALLTKTILDTGGAAPRRRRDRSVGHPGDQHHDDEADRGANQPGRVRRAVGQGTGPGRLPVPGVRLHPVRPTDPRPDDPSTTTPVVIGVPVTTTIEGAASGYVPEADQAAALDVTARFVDAWYAGGSDQAWRDQVSRWADPTLARQLPTLNRDVLPGGGRITEPAMRAFQPGLASTGVATTAGSLALTVIYTDAGWRVVTVTAEAP